MATLFLLGCTLTARGEDAVIPGKFIVEPPTLLCAGFEWAVLGDDNHNATVSVRFRPVGTAEFREGLPLLRINRERIYGHSQRWTYETPNMFAGSLFDLTPDTEYECKFTMTDPDGVNGVATQTITVRTRAEPKPFVGGRTYHVYPPGYDGPKEQPAFTGLNEAYYGIGNLGDWWMVPDARVEPGDVILMHAGLYKADRWRYADPLALDFHGTYVLTKSGTPDRPIVIKAAGDGEVIFDGDGAYRLFDVMAADYTYFEGLTIRNTDIVFYAGLKHVKGSSGLTVKNCRMEDIGIGVLTHSAESKDFYIADNVLIGRHDRTKLHGWAGFDDPAPITSYVAIKVYGQGHVICHNYVAYFHDGICIDTHGLPEEGQDRKCVSIDIYNNDIFLMADDFVEADGGVHNIRIFRNRGLNAYHSALSGQPVFGGPAYYIRNVCYQIPTRALKFSIRPAGLIVYNNTFCGPVRPSRYSNGHFRNNLFLGTQDDRPALTTSTYTAYTSFDYNGYRRKPASADQFVWWSPPAGTLRDYRDDGITTLRFKTLAAFSQATGQERHGVWVDYDVFENVARPDPAHPERVYTMDKLDFRLKPGSAAIDAGCLLPTITDGFTGRRPDLGAYERGVPLPVYGPRKGTR